MRYSIKLNASRKEAFASVRELEPFLIFFGERDCMYLFKL